MNTLYKGLTYVERAGNKPWKAQIVLGGKTYYLGNFATDEEGARAFDNCAYYANVRKVNTRNVTLNFNDASITAPLERTSEVMLNLAERGVLGRSGEPGRMDLITHLRTQIADAQRLILENKALLQRYGVTV